MDVSKVKTLNNWTPFTQKVKNIKHIIAMAMDTSSKQLIKVIRLETFPNFEYTINKFCNFK